jgi:pimeloyl-ACP methyl ester carboxylesterase
MPYTVPEQASDLIAFIQALGAGPVHVVGGSYGARVVLEAAVRRPDVFKTAAPSEAFVTGPSLWRFCAVWQAKQLADDLARIGVPMQKVDTVAATAQMVNAVYGDPTAWDRLEPERRQRFLDNQTFLRHQRPLDAVPSVGRAALRGFQRTALLVPGQCWRRGAANS